MNKSYLVTGGTGFLGRALVRRLVKEGHVVRVLDNNWRGRIGALSDIQRDIQFLEGDIRDEAAVKKACQGVDSVCHLAFINGTEYFYSMPDLVLEVAVKGMMNVIQGCLRAGVPELIVASSSEVYQTPPSIPTDESAPLSVPDPLNPRYSYGGGKIISELLTVNYGRKHFKRALLFRPHNVYGPDMGKEHVIPQFIIRMLKLMKGTSGAIKFPIQGTGKETRAFVYIDDFIDGLTTVIHKGEHLGIYHIGTMEEVLIETVVRTLGRYFGRDVEIVPGEPAKGGAFRRCPDIKKLRALGYEPKISLEKGLTATADWYSKHLNEEPNTR